MNMPEMGQNVTFNGENNENDYDINYYYILGANLDKALKETYKWINLNPSLKQSNDFLKQILIFSFFIRLSTNFFVPFKGVPSQKIIIL